LKQGFWEYTINPKTRRRIMEPIAVKDYLKDYPEVLTNRWILTSHIKRMKKKGFIIKKQYNPDKKTYESVIAGMPRVSEKQVEALSLVSKLYNVIDNLVSEVEDLREQNKQLASLKLPLPPSRKIEEALIKYGD